MGSRKRQRAELIKEKKEQIYCKTKQLPDFSQKNETCCGYDQRRRINRALDLLKFSSKGSSRRIEKLLLSAISNWQNKNENARIDESNLFVKEIYVTREEHLRESDLHPREGHIE